TVSEEHSGARRGCRAGAPGRFELAYSSYDHSSGFATAPGTESAALDQKSVSRKSARIAAMIENLRGNALDAHYLGYFECFNQQLFYEAHDVLEELWLGHRGQANDLFFKGLIQLAGAFVHLQKGRLQPAGALF